MGILRDFERRLENVVEGFFARALPGGGVQPVELGKRMVRAMDEQKTVSVANVYVPNDFTFHLAPRDIERLRPVAGALETELSNVARRAAQTENWRLLGPPRIHLEEDDSLAPGVFRVTAEVVEGPDAQADAGAHTQLIQMSTEHDAELVVVGAKRRPYPLAKEALSIGRLDECDVVLSDPGVSRRHAEVRREGDEWVVVDLDSTNGTLVNGKTVRRHRLTTGDRIELGETTIEFRGS